MCDEIDSMPSFLARGFPGQGGAGVTFFAGRNGISWHLEIWFEIPDCWCGGGLSW